MQKLVALLQVPNVACGRGDRHALFLLHWMLCFFEKLEWMSARVHGHAAVDSMTPEQCPVSEGAWRGTVWCVMTW